MSRPKIPADLLRRILDPEIREDVLRDLQLRFEEIGATRGWGPARRWYWTQALAAVGPALTSRIREWREGPGVGDVLLQDVRFAFRQIRHQPGLAAVVILMLALGIGANSAVFSVINGVLLDPLPYADSDRILRVLEDMPDDPDQPRTTHAVEMFQEWREGSSTAAEVTAYLPLHLTLSGAGDPLLADGFAVPASFFSLFRVSPALGRPIAADEEESGSDGVVVLSHSLWRQRFGGDPGVLGRTVALDGRVHTVIGVMPEGFRFDGVEADFWIPLVISAPIRDSGRRLRSLPLIVRLADGATLSQATAEANAVLDGLRENGPPTIAMIHRGTIRLVPLKTDLVGDLRLELWMLQGAVALVLLIACSNVASLLLARAATREREMAVRLALGCGRGRLIRQLLTESTILSLLAGLAGSVLAVWGLTLLIELSPDRIPRLEEVRLDGPVLAFSLALSLATGVFFGFAPGLRALSHDVRSALHAGGRSGGVIPKQRLRNVLVVSQVALALMLTVSAGLLVSTLGNLNRTDPGYDPTDVATLRMDLPPSRYGRMVAQSAFFDELLVRIGTMPSVQDAAITYILPLSQAYLGGGFLIQGRPPPTEEEDVPRASFSVVSPGFFRTMGIPMTAGEGFSATGGHPHAVVSEVFVREFFPGENPVGQVLMIAGSSNLWEIVGVAGDVRPQGLTNEPEPTVYLSYLQVPDAFEEKGLLNGGYYLLAKTSTDPVALTGELREAVHSVDPDMAVFDLASMEQRISDSLDRSRFYALSLSLLAAVALVLVAAGIHGMANHFVSRRVHEIGVRTALGARPGGISGLVVRQGLALTVVGIVLGFAGAWGVKGVLSGFLYGVTPADPPTYLAITILLVLVTLGSLYTPIRKATRIDPVEALRFD